QDMAAGSTSIPIDSSNIGFKLLQKHGWREGTGLGVSEQGRLEPVEAFIKKNKRGLGADEPRKVMKQQQHSVDSKVRHHSQGSSFLRKEEAKGASKKTRKRQEIEQRWQEKEFDRAFFREFWPDNV
ncbi:hypothetical protein M569_07231, partial [Genlisea aurea]